MRLVLTFLGWILALKLLLLLSVAIAGVLVPPLAGLLTHFAAHYGIPVSFEATLGVLIVAALVVFGLLLVLLIVARLSRRQPAEAPAARAQGQLDADEVRIMQEIHRGLTRMDERIEALETLLMERAEQRVAERFRTVEGGGRETR